MIGEPAVGSSLLSRFRVKAFAVFLSPPLRGVPKLREGGATQTHFSQHFKFAGTQLAAGY